jgi:hypothetical protein
MMPYVKTTIPASFIVPVVSVAKAPPTIRAVMALIKTLSKKFRCSPFPPPNEWSFLEVKTFKPNKFTVPFESLKSGFDDLKIRKL